MSLEVIINHLAAHWVMWAVSVTLVVAAVIDGLYLKVPNKITYPLIVAGWIYSFAVGGFVGLGLSLLATFVGFACLFFLHLIGGMGAGDVKSARRYRSLCWCDAYAVDLCSHHDHRRHHCPVPDRLDRPVDEALYPRPGYPRRNQKRSRR